MRYNVLFAHFSKFTAKRYRDIFVVFPSLETAWRASPNDLRALPWEESFRHEFILWRDSVNPDAIFSAVEKEKISCITIDESAYPNILTQVFDPPVAVFVRGTIPESPQALAVVGARSCSPYGKQVTEDIVRDLANYGITIVSGLALGIDGAAHSACLAVGGRTIAVLGGGVNRQHVYPPTHRSLADQIVASGGAVMSEYPPGTLPTNYTFPKRNRIIAGLSQGTLVIEATEKSGALITAQYALDNNREVFAIPQNITSPTAAGTNNLIKTGAHPVTSAQDILEVFHIEELQATPKKPGFTPESPTEAALGKALSLEPTHIDTIIKTSGLPSHIALSTLTLLEMKGKVRNLGSMMYVLAR